MDACFNRASFPTISSSFPATDDFSFHRSFFGFHQQIGFCTGKINFFFSFHQQIDFFFGFHTRSISVVSTGKLLFLLRFSYKIDRFLLFISARSISSLVYIYRSISSLVYIYKSISRHSQQFLIGFLPFSLILGYDL